MNLPASLPTVFVGGFLNSIRTARWVLQAPFRAVAEVLTFLTSIISSRLAPAPRGLGSSDSNVLADRSDAYFDLDIDDLPSEHVDIEIVLESSAPFDSFGADLAKSYQEVLESLNRTATELRRYSVATDALRSYESALSAQSLATVAESLILRTGRATDVHVLFEAQMRIVMSFDWVGHAKHLSDLDEILSTQGLERVPFETDKT